MIQQRDINYLSVRLILCQLQTVHSIPERYLPARSLSYVTHMNTSGYSIRKNPRAKFGNPRMRRSILYGYVKNTKTHPVYKRQPFTKY